MTRRMREALVQAKVALQKMREALARTEAEVAAERQQLADAERRGRLAEGIGDRDTAEVAQRFARKHADRLAVLERKLQAQRDELALAEREVEEMRAELGRAERERGVEAAQRGVEEAWRRVEQAGGTRGDTDVADELLKSDLDRAALEAQAQAQLEALKKKMGR